MSFSPPRLANNLITVRLNWLGNALLVRSCLDLGILIASYLLIWLSSLVISRTYRRIVALAATPSIQPSISAFDSSLFWDLSQNTRKSPWLLKAQVSNSAGLALVQQIQAMIQYSKNLGNMGICTCLPVLAMSSRIPTVFGNAKAI